MISFRHIIVNTVRKGGKYNNNNNNNNNLCVIAILALVQGWFNPRLTLATNICLWLLKTTDVPLVPSIGFCSLHLKTKFLLPGACLNRKKATDILVLYGCPDNWGFIWAGQRTKTIPSPLGRTGDLNRPSFAKRRREEGKSFQYVVALPTSLGTTFRAVRWFLLFRGSDGIACWLRARIDGCFKSVLVWRAECEGRCWSGRTSCLCASCG